MNAKGEYHYYHCAAIMNDRCHDKPRLRAEVETVTADAGRLAMELVNTPEPAAKRAIARVLGEAESRRESLQAAIAALADKSTFDAQKLTASVRAAFERARESFASMLTPTEVHAVIENYIGQVTVQPDGTLRPKTATASASAEAVEVSIIAGARFATGILRLVLLRTMVSMMRR